MPSLERDTAAVELSVVVPAYNETKRIGTMLQDAVQYLESADRLESTGKVKLPSNVQRGTYEILVVDDGSKDGTAAHVLALAKDLAITGSRGQVKVVQLAKNRGKGGATRHVSSANQYMQPHVEVSDLLHRVACTLPVTQSCSVMQMARLISLT